MAAFNGGSRCAAPRKPRYPHGGGSAHHDLHERIGRQRRQRRLRRKRLLRLASSPSPLTSSTSSSSTSSTSDSTKQSSELAGITASVTSDRRRRGHRTEQVRIVADERNNKLLIKASGRDLRRILSILRRIDQPPMQVLINATLAEVTLNDNLNTACSSSWKRTDGKAGRSGSATAWKSRSRRRCPASTSSSAR